MIDMKSILIAAALPLAAMACATAQSGSQGAKSVTLATGTSLNYSMLSTMDMAQSMGGQEINILFAMDGSMILTAGRQASDQFAWTLDTRDMHVSSESPMLSVDTTITLPTQRFTTTPLGRLLNVETSGEKGSEMSQMMMGLGGGREQLASWFSPMLGTEHKVGETWQVQTNDTVNNDAMGMEMRRKWTTTYTYEASVDTLGTKAARVRMESSGMNIEGEMSVQGMNLGVDGDGAISGVSYYSLTDGLLLASKTENQMNMQVSMSEQGGMVIPITQRMNTTIVRRPKPTVD
jgi:hypothetical protein